MHENSPNLTLTENVGFNKSLENYKKAALFLNIASRNIYNENLPSHVINSWINLLSAMRIADTIIDSETNSKKRRGVMERAIQYLQSDNLSLLDINPNLAKHEQVFIKLRDDVYNLNQPKKTTFANNLLRLLEIGEEIKSTHDIHHFSYLTRLEGQVASRLVLVFVPEEFSAKPKHADFIKFLTRITRIGNIGDKFFDMASDFVEKEIECSPSIKNRLSLLSMALVDTPTVIKSLHIDQLQAIIQMVYGTFENNTRKQKQVVIR